MGEGYYNFCVIRCYYAMFFMVEAMLFSRGIMEERMLFPRELSESGHRCIIKSFCEHFVKTGIVEAEFGKMLRRAYDLRQKGDYVIMGSAVSEREARECLEGAKSFVSRMESYIKKVE